jgi:RNA:NAD 2'-phosphotransferase (TPT1/KptA family)
LSASQKGFAEVHELWNRVKVEWNEIAAETCQTLIESMPRRIKAVIRANGGHTKY